MFKENNHPICVKLNEFLGDKNDNVSISKEHLFKVLNRILEENVQSKHNSKMFR